MTRGHPSPNPVYVDPATGARMKHCPSCGEERSIDGGEFPTRDNPHGTGVQYRWQCRQCETARYRAYRAANLTDCRERDRIRHRKGRRRY
jgi:hypothetical protein